MGSGSSKSARITVQPRKPNTHATAAEKTTSQTNLRTRGDEPSDRRTSDINPEVSRNISREFGRTYICEADPNVAVEALSRAPVRPGQGVGNSRITELSHSARSEASGDSGIFELSEEYGHIITEHSAPQIVAEVQNDFTAPIDISDLVILGKPVPRLLSGSQRNRLEEQEVMKMLQHEGLITTSRITSGNSTSFEIVEVPGSRSTNSAGQTNSSVGQRLPPVNRKRLDQRRKSHARTVNPEVDLHEKELRRKAAEEQKVRKIAYRQQNLEAAIQKRAEEQEQQLRKRIGSALDKRQSHLNNLRDRLREKHNRGEEVKQRRVLSLVTSSTDSTLTDSVDPTAKESTELVDSSGKERAASIDPPSKGRSDSVNPPAKERTASVDPPAKERADSVNPPDNEITDSDCPAGRESTDPFKEITITNHPSGTQLTVSNLVETSPQSDDESFYN